jgi:hypothetical protein
MRANENCLAVSIKQLSKSNSHWRIDIFDLSLVRMYRGVNLKVGGLATYMTPFDEQSWLVVNGNDIWLLGEQADIIEESKYDSADRLHNVLVKREDLLGQRQFILKVGQPAELRIVSK